MSERMPMTEYLALKAFSGGLAARLIADSPYQAYWESPWNPDRPRDDSSAADIGTYAHAMLLEGEHSALEVIDAEDWRTKAAREARDAARAAGKLPILARQIAPVEGMVAEALDFINRTELAGIFEDGESELTFTWDEAGVPCKIRPDRLSGDSRICLSYKTTKATANPRAWIRTQLPGYEVSMPLYERGIVACRGVDACRVVHLVQSQSAPYACSLVALAPSRQDLAERQLDTALAIWKKCLAEHKFPAYPTEICYAEAEAWREAQFSEQHEGASPTEAEVMAALQRGTGSAPDYEIGGQP